MYILQGIINYIMTKLIKFEKKGVDFMKEKLENNLDSESYELISESKTSTEFKLKFKLLEVFSHNGLFTAKN